MPARSREVLRKRFQVSSCCRNQARHVSSGAIWLKSSVSSGRFNISCLGARIFVDGSHMIIKVIAPCDTRCGAAPIDVALVTDARKAKTVAACCEGAIRIVV